MRLITSRARLRDFVTAISGAKHEQRISKAGYAEANPPRPLRAFGLLGQWKARSVNYIVQESHGHLHRLHERLDLQPGLWREGKAYETGEIDRAKIACAIRGERDLTAGIRGADPFTIPKIVEPVDSVDKEHARLGILIRGAQ